MREPRWHWRNCRDLSLSIWLTAWPWSRPRAVREDDVYGGFMAAMVGPAGVRLDYGIGSVSSECGVVAATGLSEMEAYERARRYEGLEP